MENLKRPEATDKKKHYIHIGRSPPIKERAWKYSSSESPKEPEIPRVYQLLPMLYSPNGPDCYESLYELTEKGVQFDWSESCKSAFNTLRRNLTEQAVKLSYPRREEDMYVETDSSGMDTTAILSQKDDQTGVLQTISYFSSALNDSQKTIRRGSSRLGP